MHEIKYDEYGTQFVVAARIGRAFNGHDWTAKYGLAIAVARTLRRRSAIVDCEMCVQNATGITDFKAFQSVIGSAPERLVLFAFDLLMLDGGDFRAEPLVVRRRYVRL